MAYVRQPSESVPGGSPMGDAARPYRQPIDHPLLSEASARRVTPHDGELLRTLMLAATQVPTRAIEHRVFEARPSADWDVLVADRATADRRAIFVLAPPAPAMGEGLLWCSVRRACTVADLGWWWLHRPLEATPAEQALFEVATGWAAERGVTTLVAAADDHREQASLVRAGFVHHGLASDGHRAVLARRTTTTALVD